MVSSLSAHDLFTLILIAIIMEVWAVTLIGIIGYGIYKGIMWIIEKLSQPKAAPPRIARRR